MELDPLIVETMRKFPGDAVTVLESKGLFPVRLYFQKKSTSIARVFIASQTITYATLFFTLLEHLRPLLELPYPPSGRPSLKELKAVTE